jgi:uncharacterized protein YyaL (SSP411 family)
MHKFTNQLIHETSSYLLQHSHNPVNWYPWGEEALKKAKQENKPILVSIGYAACHWCHVMERESFEDEATAQLMNDNFINIKIDREERPDIDHIYMDAVQAMTGSGGWPLNVFLTPEAKPFYGGTYFPPQRAFNRPSWQETLLSITQTFKERRNEVDAQAENLTEHLLQSNLLGQQKESDTNELFSKKKLDEAVGNIMRSADKEWGGFGKAPKFPQTFTIQFLLRYYYISKNQEALDQAILSIDKMLDGGIYDQIGGGFSRYSTDTEWLAPHFEKMLYDNALLISVISEAYQLTKKERYKEVIEETMNFLQRELLNTNKGFYSALDADSEGVEGKFYMWDRKQTEKILGVDAIIFCEYFDISENGNWEGKNIIRVKEPVEKFALKKNIALKSLKTLLKRGKEKLLEGRSKRIRPALDDKIILGWNALMNTACSKAFAATGNESYRQLAIENMRFILEKFNSSDSGSFFHTWKNNIAKYPAFLDDYAFLIEALIHLQEITADTKWLQMAKEITEFVIDNFNDTSSPFFYYTNSSQQDVIIRKKEIYDGAIPSGNSVMAYNFRRLSILFDNNEWRQRSEKMVLAVGNIVPKYPTSFGIWGCLLQEIIVGTFEIAVVGNQNTHLHADLLKQYIPHKVLMASKKVVTGFPLLANKPILEQPLIYLCSNYTCHNPVISVTGLISLINSTNN